MGGTQDEEHQEGEHMPQAPREVTRLIPSVVALALLGTLAGMPACHHTQSTHADPPPIFYEGFGNYTRTMTTASEEAQRWFNQGMQLTYGFNHDEAVRSFEQAALADPEAAMPWWGIAYC